MLDGIAERARNWFLACYFVEGLGTPLPCDYLIGHRIVFALISRESWSRIFFQKLPQNGHAVVIVYTHDFKSDQQI